MLPLVFQISEEQVMTVHDSWTLDAIVESYKQYQRRVRGLRERTLQGYEQILRPFLRLSLVFEACSTFTHVIACIFVKPPKVALCTGVLSSRFTPWAAAPITTGWSDICRAGFAPAGRPCLCTAHG
jgi:hypothetical protein